MKKVVRVLGVDPAWSKPTRWAYIALASCDEKPAILNYGGGTFAEFDSFMSEMKPDYVAIEDQFMKQNYDTAKKLSWITGGIMAIAQLHGVEYRIVNVASWKARMLGPRQKNDKGKYEYSLTPIEAARKFWRGIELSDDEACAALIGYYQAFIERNR